MIASMESRDQEKQIKEIFDMISDNNKEFRMVKTTCDAFTRLLLSLTPFKAKEFVEKNCAKVTEMILAKSANALIKGVKDE